jgi:hypothetical protein
MVRRVIRGSSRAGRSEVFDPDPALLRLWSREVRVVLDLVASGRSLCFALLRWVTKRDAARQKS